MRLILSVFLLTVVGGPLAFRLAHTSARAPEAGDAERPAELAQEASTQEINDRFVKQVLERIADHRTAPAEQVFKNIQWLKGVPAERFLLIMNRGYSRALGVTCTHCHVEQDFASDDKRPKRAAREMAAMHRMINEQLKKMQNIEAKVDERAINCSTCHRGAVSPLAAGR